MIEDEYASYSDCLQMERLGHRLVSSVQLCATPSYAIVLHSPDDDHDENECMHKKLCTCTPVEENDWFEWIQDVDVANACMKARNLLVSQQTRDIDYELYIVNKLLVGVLESRMTYDDRIMPIINRILDRLSVDNVEFLPCNDRDSKKRASVLECARRLAIHHAVRIGMTSHTTREFHYDRHDASKYIGFNPRVITMGIMPFVVVSREMINDAIYNVFLNPHE